MAANFLESGAEKRSSAVVVDVVEEPELPGLAMVRQSEPRETQALSNSIPGSCRFLVSTPKPVPVPVSARELSASAMW